jgi:hypothetical protein
MYVAFGMTFCEVAGPVPKMAPHHKKTPARFSGPGIVVAS